MRTINGEKNTANKILATLQVQNEKEYKVLNEK